MAYCDFEDLETDTMYPPGHNMEPVKYMKIITIPKHPQALERYFAYKAKRKNESNKHIS